MLNNETKIKMLDEFENGLYTIYEQYNQKKYTFDECKNYLKTYLLSWDFARLDIKNYGEKSNYIEIIEKNEKLAISFPTWFTDSKGKGCKIESSSNNINLKFKCIGDGDLNITLRGMDLRIPDNIKIPIFVNFTKLLINDEIILNEKKLVWHDEPLFFKGLNKNDNSFILNLHVQKIFDFYPILKIYLDNIDDESDLKNKLLKISTYITYEKLLLQLNNIESNIFNSWSDL